MKINALIELSMIVVSVVFLISIMLLFYYFFKKRCLKKYQCESTKMKDTAKYIHNSKFKTCVKGKIAA